MAALSAYARFAPGTYGTSQAGPASPYGPATRLTLTKTTLYL